VDRREVQRPGPQGPGWLHRVVNPRLADAEGI